MDGVRQQLLTGAGFAQQQHRAGRLRGTPSLALDFLRSRAGAHETGEGVLGAAPAGQLAAGLVQVLLQPRELGDEGLQRGLGMIEQHDAQHPDDCPRVVAQRDATDHEGASLVGQQVDQDRFASLQHLVHLRVLHHAGDRVTDEVFLAFIAQCGQKAAVLVVDPHHASFAVHQQHAFAGIGEQVEHGTRRQFQNALGVARQSVFSSHGRMLSGRVQRDSRPPATNAARV